MLWGLSRYIQLKLGSVANTPSSVELVIWWHQILILFQPHRMVTSLVEVREDGSDTGSTVPTNRLSRKSSVGTSPDSQYRIPPRPPMRETEGLSSTTSTALPSGHPVLEMLNQVFQHSVTSGRLTGPFKGISSYCLELFVLVSAEDGDAMFGELLAGRGGWLNWDGQAEHWVPIVDTIDFWMDFIAVLVSRSVLCLEYTVLFVVWIMEGCRIRSVKYSNH
jgi:hypothetical protein